MNLYRHIPFLRSVLSYSLTAFGGPQGHMGMMIKTFVEERKDVTHTELIDFMSFCQMLPGPSSTQTITLIGYKRGGVGLALITLLIWILPAAILMGGLAFLVHYFDIRAIQTNLFRYIQPMGVGFLLFAAYKAMRISVRHPATVTMMLVALLAAMLIRSPWVFPILLLAGGTVSNFSNRRIPDVHVQRKPVKWVNIWWFLLVFVIAGIFSEAARVSHWPFARGYNLFENFYRFGSIVFGGGHALIPMMYEQFVTRPESMHLPPYLNAAEFLTGTGMVNAIPGPVVSICTYVGALSLRSYGWHGLLAGSAIATLGVFLPSILLLFFFFPIYQNLKQYTVIYRALEGIHAVVVGIMWASGFLLFQSMPFDWTNLIVILITFSLLNFSKIPAPLIVMAWLLLGWAM